VKYEARLENGTLVSKSDEGLEFNVGDGKLNFIYNILQNYTAFTKNIVNCSFLFSGTGCFCPAFSKTVKTMRRGEKAELFVKFSCKLMYFSAFFVLSTIYREDILNLSLSFSDGFRQNEKGATDIDDGVPFDSNLTIKLELVSWKSVVDVTRDKKVLKKIMKVGEGFDRPNEGSLVKGNLTDKAHYLLKLPL
jgi:FK506-binding protein 4/5